MMKPDSRRFVRELTAALDVTTGYSAFSLGIGGWY